MRLGGIRVYFRYEFPTAGASFACTPPRVEPCVLSKVLSQVIIQLEQARESGLLQAYALIGSFAVSAWGVLRATQGIDLAVALMTAQPNALASSLSTT